MRLSEAERRQAEIRLDQAKERMDEALEALRKAEMEFASAAMDVDRLDAEINHDYPAGRRALEGERG